MDVLVMCHHKDNPYILPKSNKTRGFEG